MAENIFTTSSTGTAATAPAPETFNLSGLKDSTDWTVEPKTQTVSGQLESVLANDSPLMQQARTRAMQAMNSRGLTNSSMAVGAADSAMYDAALPIAQGNAAVYSDAAKTNAAQKNQFSMASNNQAYDLQKMGVQQDYTQANMNLQQQNELAKMGVQQGYTLQNMSVDQQNQLARMAAQQGYNLQTMTAQQINDLQKMQQQQQNNLQTMATQQGFDLAKMDAQTRNTLLTMSADQQNQLARMATAQGYSMQTLNQQQVNDLQRMAVQQQNNLQTLSTQYGFDLGRMDAQTRNTLTTMSAEQQNRMATLAAQNGYDLSKMNLQQTLDLAKLDKQTAAAIQVADIEAAYKNLTQASASASSIITKMQESLNILRANTNITDPAVRTKEIADIKTNAMEALNLIGALSGDVNLSSYISQVGL